MDSQKKYLLKCETFSIMLGKNDMITDRVNWKDAWSSNATRSLKLWKPPSTRTSPRVDDPCPSDDDDYFGILRSHGDHRPRTSSR